jgi:hypothetical protein
MKAKFSEGFKLLALARQKQKAERGDSFKESQGGSASKGQAIKNSAGQTSNGEA